MVRWLSPLPPDAHRPFWLAALVPSAFALFLLVVAPLAFGPPAALPPDAPADSLMRRAAFLEARLAAAEDGALSLSLDLADSTLTIESGGVPLRRCRVHAYRTGPAAAHAYASGEDTPALFHLAALGGTIPRVPVRAVEAPADSAEAASRPPAEVPVETRAAYATLRFDRGLVVHLRPSEASVGSRVLGGGRWAWERAASAARTAVARGASAEAWVEVELAPEDVRAVYRALPDGGHLALRLP